MTEYENLNFWKTFLVANSTDNNIPGVDGARGAHKGGQDRIGGKDLTLVAQVTNN